MTITLTPNTFRHTVRVAPTGVREVKQMSDEELREALRERREATPAEREAAQRESVRARSAAAVERLRNLSE